MIKPESRIPVVDNSGVIMGKCIRVLYKKNDEGIAGDIIVVSTQVVTPNRKITKGQIFYALIIKTRCSQTRVLGQIAKDMRNGAILLKKNELTPYSNRLKGCVFLEIRKQGYAKLLSISDYVI